MHRYNRKYFNTLLDSMASATLSIGMKRQLLKRVGREGFKKERNICRREYKRNTKDPFHPVPTPTTSKCEA